MRHGPYGDRLVIWEIFSLPRLVELVILEVVTNLLQISFSSFECLVTVESMQTGLNCPSEHFLVSSCLVN